MNYNKTAQLLTLLLATLSVSALADYYRYVGDNNRVVVVDHLNEDAIRLGYERLNNSGQVIEVVDRAMTREESAKVNADKIEAQRLQEWDEQLLLKYSTISDIEAALKRAQRDIDVRLGILKSNQSVLKTQLSNERTKAANLERNHREVPEDLQLRIKNLGLELDSVRSTIAMRRKEKLTTSESFQRDIERFEELKAIAGSRNLYHSAN
ncbi:hypothetical protein SIN8267_03282 [Sinobacterium norvegicum]|uniref:DUF4124 domain-containing protein n=1 Tax=Sinobacterium norvegicum TaxID=1641715 RepID=A0ABN8EQ83_9GAMM|nr:hypothetical protein [Sinobacterium norvegicum]CAH0993143.1 hypothetical protein SIN8267_03282 [Sinobacterium norvegicum]